jgi:predicted MFS family arabinose efflux permease
MTSHQKLTKRPLSFRLACGRTSRMSLVLTVLVVMAHFGTYTYVTPFLRQVTGAGSVTPFLLVYLIYGAAGVVGNFVGGTTVRTRLRGTLTTGPVALTVATALLPAFGTTTVGAMLLLALWGLAYGAVPVCSQSWFAAAAPGEMEAASVLFTFSFQATIALGAVLGGVVVDAHAPELRCRPARRARRDAVGEPTLAARAALPARSAPGTIRCPYRTVIVRCQFPVGDGEEQ